MAHGVGTCSSADALGVPVTWDRSQEEMRQVALWWSGGLLSPKVPKTGNGPFRFPLSITVASKHICLWNCGELSCATVYEQRKKYKISHNYSFIFIACLNNNLVDILA